MKKKINKRFIELALFSILVTTMMMTVVFYTQLKKQVFSDLQVVADVLVEEQSYTKEFQGIRVTIVNPDGSVYFDSQVNASTLENHLNRPEIAKAMENGTGKGERMSNTVSKSVFYYAVKMDDGKVLRVGKESNSVVFLFLSSLPIVCIVAFIIMGISLMVSHYLTKEIISPIDNLANHMDSIEEKEIYPELVPFTKKIRSQHEEILGAANVRQEFTANVSHELKTPLAVISGYAELMEAGFCNDAVVKRFSHEIRKSAVRWLSLINDIIKLSELDDGCIEDVLEIVDIAQIAKESVEMLSINAKKNHISIVYAGQESANIRIGKELAQELVYNLIENAVRYNVQNGSVIVSVVEKEGKISLCVQDTGIGISKEHVDRIFERFYRVDKSRSKELGGTGLGLAIVKHIVTLTNGEIHLQSEVNKGTTITIIWNR